MTKKFRPVTPGQRELILEGHADLTKGIKPEKSLIVKKNRTNGRNHHGHITCRHLGGGHKRFYRMVDFKRDKFDVPAQVASLEYDPN
ncbi:MAG: 50S ribosomal protein L2, partial [Rhabdochlamydiaceae bacterium]